MYKEEYIRMIVFTKQPKKFKKLLKEFFWLFEDVFILSEETGCFEINTMLTKQEFHELADEHIKKYVAIQIDKLEMDEILDMISSGQNITNLMKSRLEEIQKSL